MATPTAIASRWIPDPATNDRAGGLGPRADQDSPANGVRRIHRECASVWYPRWIPSRRPVARPRQAHDDQPGDQRQCSDSDPRAPARRLRRLRQPAATPPGPSMPRRRVASDGRSARSTAAFRRLWTDAACPRDRARCSLPPWLGAAVRAILAMVGGGRSRATQMAITPLIPPPIRPWCARRYGGDRGSAGR